MTGRQSPARHGDVTRAPGEPTSEGAVSGAAAPGRLARVLAVLLFAAKLALGVVLILGASGLVAYGAYRYAMTTPRFALRTVVLQGNQRFTEADVLARAGVQPGDNLLGLDLRVAERRLLEDPWVAAARLRRRLPDTLEVELEERQAVALAAVGERLYLLARDGTPFKEVLEGDPYDLPAVTGISAEGLARDRARELERVAVGLELLRHWEQVPASRVHAAQELHLGEDGTLTLTVGKGGTTLALGKGPWRRKLLMAARVLASLQGRGQTPGVVFLDNEAHPERVVVRLR